MGIITKEVEVKLWGNNIKHYHDLGYDGKHGDIITVKTEDLSDGSNVKIQYLCDYCQEEIITVVYADYVRRTKEINKMACKKCFMKKAEETVLLKYGSTSYAKTDEFHEIMKSIMLIKYGVEHYSQTQEYKEKWHKTCVERYGNSYRKKFMDKAFETFRERTGYDYPSQSPEIRKKITQSYIDHYGVSNPQLSAEIREQTEKTNLERYGYSTPCQSPEIKTKMTQSLYKNGTTPTSKQQLYIFNLYRSTNNSVELNYPISYYNGDICFLEEKINVEIDFGGHDLQVKTGQATQKEFNKRQIIRDNVIKKEGYKRINIVSRKDFLPSDTILLQMLEDARHYFQTTQHTWQTYDIDQSLLFNAEHPDGIPYSYGSLRTIKDSDLQNKTNLSTATAQAV